MVARHKKDVLHVNTLGIYSSTAWQQLLKECGNVLCSYITLYFLVKQIKVALKVSRLSETSPARIMQSDPVSPDILSHLRNAVVSGKSLLGSTVL